MNLVITECQHCVLNDRKSREKSVSDEDYRTLPSHLSSLIFPEHIHQNKQLNNTNYILRHNTNLNKLY